MLNSVLSWVGKLGKHLMRPFLATVNVLWFLFLDTKQIVKIKIHHHHIQSGGLPKKRFLVLKAFHSDLSLFL